MNKLPRLTTKDIADTIDTMIKGHKYHFNKNIKYLISHDPATGTTVGFLFNGQDYTELSVEMEMIENTPINKGHQKTDNNDKSI